MVNGKGTKIATVQVLISLRDADRLYKGLWEWRGWICHLRSGVRFRMSSPETIERASEGVCFGVCSISDRGPYPFPIECGRSIGRHAAPVSTQYPLKISLRCVDGALICRYRATLACLVLNLSKHELSRSAWLIINSFENHSCARWISSPDRHCRWSSCQKRLYRSETMCGQSEQL